jgi:putative tryptophan/tyrosine transport system substrate-binding protein
MRRREFISLLGGAAVAWPFATRAQQPAIPEIGFLRSTPSEPFIHLVAAFRHGLKEAGFVAGDNVKIEQRWADDQPDRLAALAADLVRRRVDVIVGNYAAVEAARAMTETIPIVLVTGDDPVRSGMVRSLNRPGGNITGITFFGGSQLNAKRLELLHELVPKAALIGVLGDPNHPAFETELPDLVAAARIIDRQIVIARAASERDLDAAFASIVRAGAGALLVSGSPFFTSQRRQLVALAARHAIPAIYDLRELVAAGGLISYSASLAGAYRQAGNYTAQILNGKKPSELPVLQATTFELAVNLKAAKALGLEVPPSVMLRADEVIE